MQVVDKRCAGNIAPIGEFEGRMRSTLTVCLKLIVLKDRDGADIEFDPTIVRLAVSQKGSVLDFLIVISREFRLKTLGLKLISALDKWSTRIKLAIPREFDAS